MKVKDLKKMLDKYNDDDNIFFEIEGDEYGSGNRAKFPIGIFDEYRSEEGVTILFEDN